MDFRTKFDRIADTIESLVNDGDSSHLGRAAVEALSRHQDLLTFDPSACLHWLLTSPRLPGQSWENNFGEPSVTVARRPGFRVDILYWTQNSLPTHKHVSCGAFAAIGGGRLHTSYNFDTADQIGDNIWTGKLTRLNTELMHAGDIREIQPGFIHDLYWVNTPSVTLSIRCDNHPGGQHELPLEYHWPGLAILNRVHQDDALVSKRVTGLRLMAKVDQNLYRQTLLNTLSEGSPLLAYHAFRDSLLLLHACSADDILAEANRIDGLGAQLAAAAPLMRHRMLFESIFCGANKRAQLLAGVLWTGIQDDALKSLLSEAFPNELPANVLYEVGAELSTVTEKVSPYLDSVRPKELDATVLS